MKINLIKGRHLTTLDKALIKAVFLDNIFIGKTASTKFKRLFITAIDEKENISADLYSYENGIGVGSKASWYKKGIIFNVKK